MISTLTQEDISIFSSDPVGAKERPGTPYYTEGVEVGYTAPAKWWNWFWNTMTIFLTASKADRQNILSEFLSILSSASTPPSNLDSHQLSKATSAICYNVTEEYDNETITEVIDGVQVTHKVNQPYVVGHTLYVPDTELL